MGLWYMTQFYVYASLINDLGHTRQAPIDLVLERVAGKLTTKPYTHT